MKYCVHCMREIDSRESVCPYCAGYTSFKQPKPYLPQGTVLLDRYLIGKMIKRNADSAIYIGRDTSRGKIIEIREFFPETVALRAENMTDVCASEGHTGLYDEYLKSFIQLWKNLMRFKGLPALFDVCGVFENNGTAYAVTDHNDSTTFRKILDTMDVEHNPFSVKRTQSLIMSILSTVESLHTANVVHRGISPETLVLSSDGTLKITGFAIGQVRTTKNKIINSVCDGYAAIEQYDFNWQQGSWTDIYSIGALLYKMLTGRTLPPAPARLNDEEVFFTEEELKRIPEDITGLIKECLVLMPQGRIKDIHDIINVFLPSEMPKKTVTVIRSRAVPLEMKRAEKAEDEPTQRIIQPVSEIHASKEREDNKPLEIVKPKQAQAVTKTSLPKAIAITEEQRLKEQKKAEEERKAREELYLRLQAEQEKARIEDEKRRKQREEEIKRRNKEKRREVMQKSAAGRAVKKANDKAGEVGRRIKSGIEKRINPVSIAVTVGVSVAVTCVFVTFLLYGTVLYRFVDAPVLDNCLSSVSFLPVNKQDDEENTEYVKVADFRTLTREYIESDPLYTKRYNIVFEYDYCDTVEKGYVFSQSVKSGEKVAVGSTVTVYISKGVEMIEFVRVTGMQYDEAYSMLTQLGFTVNKQEVYNMGLYTQGKVISASPLSVGEKYPKGTQVTLKVWSAPPVTLPTETQPQPSESQSGSENQNPAHERDNRDFFSFFDNFFNFR